MADIPPNSAKILYVDDEPKALKYFIKAFSADFEILTAESVAEALDILEESGDEIGILLTDQRMPKATGVDLLKVVNHKWPDIVSLLVTAYSDVDDTVEAVNEGHIFQYIRKPWNPDKLKIMLLEALQEFNRIRYSKQLAIKNVKLEEAYRLQEEFIHMLSHEVRTPINVSVTLSDFLLESELDDEQRDHISSIKVVNSALANLLDNTLDYSKWVKGQLKLINRDFNLSKLLEQLDHTFRLQLQMSEIEYIVDISESAKNELHGDPDRLLQILINLIGNAIKFTPAQGRIRLNVSVVEEVGDSLVFRFAVRDSGDGIAAEAMDKLFKPFSQINGGRVGSGLGLSISKELVSMMGGEIGLTSDVGSGSEFWFTVALGRQVSKVAVVKEDELKKVTDKTVLLADDNRISRFMAQELLGRCGYEVDLADDGLDALEKAKKNKYSVILLDCQMPKMDGVEATVELRKEGINVRTPIIAFTAMPVAMLEERWLEAGINAYVQKPFERSQFVETINYWSNSSDALSSAK